MLLNTHPDYDSEVSYGSVHNYNDRLVYDQISRSITAEQENTNFIADVACVTLNRLPPRYVRHDVDMTFYLSPVELQNILNNIEKEVLAAIKFVDSRNKASKKPNKES